MGAPRIIKPRRGTIGNMRFTPRQRIRCILNGACSSSRNKKVQPSLPKLKCLEKVEP